MTPPTDKSAIADFDEFDDELDDDNIESKSSQSKAGGSTRAWLIGLGVLLVLIGGGFGLRFVLSGRNGGGPPGMMQGQGMPVRVETVERSPVQESSEFVGNLESRNSVTLRPEISGRVIEIAIEPGQQVEAGQPLIQLSPEERQADLASLRASINSARAIRASTASELEALRADRVAAVAEVELQQEEYRRAVELVEQDVFPQQELDIAERNRNSAIATLSALDRRIEAANASLAESEAALAAAEADAASAEARLQNTVIYAPFSGTIGDIPVKVGDFVGLGDELSTIIQDQVLELRLSVPIERRAELREGLRVILGDNQGTTLAEGQISFIAPQVEPGAQTVLAKASFDNRSGFLLDGQAVRARIIWTQQEGVLIPTSAISRVAGQTFVYVAVPAPPPEEGAANAQAGQSSDGPSLVAEQRPVQLGDIQGNRYQVLDGLEPGDRLIVSGILNLSDGAPIMPEAPAPTDSSNNGEESAADEANASK
jgi:RND family efflux transporter MFP subunit